MNKYIEVTKKEHRKSGVLVHPTSFPSPYGIGDLGDGAYNFIDFLVNAKQKLWQILPIGPTGFGDSPYQSFSSFAGQFLLISPDKLKEMYLLSNDDLINIPNWDPKTINYGEVIQYKHSLLMKAFDNFSLSQDQNLQHKYNNFCIDEKDWLDDYALFMACKDYHKGKSWLEWEHDISKPNKESKEKWRSKLTKEVAYYKFIQFIFFKQWFELKHYANKKNIQIIGDIPIFVALDSCDVWANPELFYLDSHGYPTIVAGVPPDYFSETGQLWGNPLYNWEKHKSSNYHWWVKRMRSALKYVDIIRIDHFRGFEAYWAIPYGNKDATEGEWRKGPGEEIFNTFVKHLGDHLPIIAEDLGIINKAVEDMRDKFNLPGMKILQFGFEDLIDNDFLPHNYNFNSICYTGTHDNDTSLGWYLHAPEVNRDKVRRYMNTDGNDISWDFIRTCIASISKMAIIPIQDLFSLDSSGRMNYPGVQAGNWQWRYTNDMLNNFIATRLATLSELFGR